MLSRVQNVTITSLTFEGCRGHPAVLIEPGNDNCPHESVVVDRVTFRNNSNFDLYQPAGGAISAGGCLAKWWCMAIIPLTVIIRDSVFDDNKSDMGGAVYGEQCTLKVLRSEFINNLANQKGGAIYVTDAGSQLEISDSHFRNNIVIEGGLDGTVYRRSGELIEHDRYFIFKSPGNGGGAVAVSSVERLSVIGTEFLTNRATSGGAIYATLDANDLTDFENDVFVRVEGCHFQDNQAAIIEETVWSNTEENIGGAIYFAAASAALKTLEIMRSTFEANRAGASGGALHIVTVHLVNIDIDGCMFDGNGAEKAGGAALLRNSGGIAQRNTTWRRNSAGLGGAVMLTNGARFTAKPVSDGSGNEDPETRNLFAENSAVDGGGLMCAGCGTMLLRNVNFERNRARRAGGGLFVLDSSRDVRIEESRFHDNVAMHGGGAALRSAASVTFGSAKSEWWNEFLRNKAASGGGVFVEGNRQKENTLQVWPVAGGDAPPIARLSAPDETLPLRAEPRGRRR